MKEFAYAIALAVSALIFPACEKPATEASAPVYHANWLTNWEAAKAAARESGKPILFTLTGSDWCSECVKLEKEIFSTKEFVDFADANLVLMVADLPKYKEIPADLKAQNLALEKRYYNAGYPAVLLLDAEGNPLSEDLGALDFKRDSWLKELRASFDAVTQEESP